MEQTGIFLYLDTGEAVMDNKEGKIGIEQNVDGQDWDVESQDVLAEAVAADHACVSSAKSRNNTAMMLLGACVLGMFGVFMFSRHQKPPEVTVEEKAAEAQVDTALAKLVEMNENDKSKDLFKNVDTMVQTFYDYPSNQQVAADDLQKNPFSRYIIDADAGQGSSKARAELEKELRKKFNQLKLQTVAGSKCVISNEVVGEGQEVADTFLVKTISTDSVVLIAEDIEFVLQM